MARTNDFTSRYLELRRERMAEQEAVQSATASGGSSRVTTPSAESGQAQGAQHATTGENDFTSRYLELRQARLSGGTEGQQRPSATPSTTRPSVMSTLRQTTPFSFSPFQFLTTRPSGGAQSGNGQQQASTPSATMSSADMSARMDELRELRDAAEKERNEARLIMTGSRYMPSSMREEQQAILDQAEANYSRYDQEYNNLLSRYYQTENEEKRASLQQDEAMSGQYQSAQDIQADMDKVSAVMAYTVTHDGDAAQVEEYKQYLFDKYGLDQKAVDQYAISGAGGAYVPRTDGGYNNIYELYLELQEKKENAVSTLSEGGYDYERMTGYEDMLEDAAQYREDMGEWQEYAREHPILSSVDTLLTAPFQGFDFLRVMGQNIGHSDRDDPENYVPMNSYDMELTNYINAVRQTVSEEIEGATNWEIFDQNVAAFLYNNGMSIGDSAVRLVAFGPSMGLFVGSSTAAANQAKDIIDRGGTAEQAFWGGVAAGAFEAIFEKVSIDSLLATKSVTGWQSWLKETAKQAGIEASEETFTEIANILADAAIMGDNSNYDVAVAEYVAQGMNQEDAERQAFFDLIGQVVQAGVGGALSGGVMGGVVNGFNGIVSNRVQSQEETSQAPQAQPGENTTTATRPISNPALAARQQLFEQAAQQQTQENTAKNGTILERTAQETEEQRQNTAEIDNDIPEATRAAIEMLVNGEEISGNQAARIAENEEAVALLSQLTGEEVNTDAPISRVKSDIRALASREGRTSGEAGENSRATQSGAQTQEQAQERPAAMQAYDVRRMEQAAQAGGFGESGRRALLAAYDGSVDGTSFYTGFSSYYNAGLSGMDMGKVQSIYAQDLTEAQRYAAYTAGQNDAAASLQREKAGVQFVPVYGDEAGLVDNDNAKRVPQQTAALYNTLAKAAGVKIELVDEITTPDGGRGGNGLYIPSRNTIQISMDTEGAVGADGKLDAGAFAAVAAHEITHRIQDLAPEQYRAYRDYAMNAMAQAQGYGTTANLVEGKLREYAEGGVNLTAEQAMDEIAADFTRDMLHDAGLFKELAQEHRSVARRVLDVLKDFIRRVKAAFSSRSAQDRAARSEYGVDMDTLEEAARLWQRAYDAATARASGKSKSAAQADGAGRFSIRYDQDNNPYVVIEEDILAGVPRSEWVKTVKDNLRQRFPDGVMVGNNVIEINAQSRREMTFSKYMQRLFNVEPQMYADKLRATNNADEIVRAARNWVNEALLHPRKDDIIDFARGEVLMRIGSNDYTAQVIVGNRGAHGLLLYDIINLAPATIQAQTKKADAVYTTNTQNGPRGRGPASANTSISETGGDVNGRFSLKERDREYLSAVESGNTEEAQRLVNEAAEAAMPESKIRGQDGRLMPVYHGTREMFWRFDTSVQGGVNGTAEGFGIYTSDNPEVTAAYGDRQLKMFANITNPATSTSKTITPKTLAALIKSTCEREARQQVADGEYDSVRDALRDTWVSNYTDTYSASMAQVYRDVARSILDMNDSDMNVIREVMTGMGIRDYADASDFYENSLIPITGIDGFVTQWENRESGTPSNIILALNSNQLKSADAITRDDSGEIIPLSQRFNPEEGDIRYSLKSTDSRGRELSEEQRRYFQGSKITDADGRLLVLYHGTTAYGEITKFRRGRSGWLGPGIYLASRQADAKRYADAMGEGNGQLYELYANVTNPLVVTEGNPVPEILRAAYGRDSVYRSRSAKQGNDAQIITTADIKKLQSKGYDGIRWDFGGSTEVSVFSPERIKRVDNLTPSGSQDVRYSLKAEDSQGRELTQEQQEFFRDSKVVDNQGRLKVMYHLSGADNITIFQSGNSAGLIYFSADRNNAKRASRASSTTYECYLNITNPVNTENTPLQWYDAENSLRVAKWKRAGHDGVYVRDESGVSVAVFSPEQIKSVTNENPTSSPDIRRSIKGGDILRQNAALQEENSLLRERVEYWRGQTRRTERVSIDKKAVERAARELIRAYNSGLDAAELAGDLQGLYSFVMNNGDERGAFSDTELRRRANEIARKLVDSAAVLEDESYRDYADLRAYLRSTPLSISAEDSHDIADFGDFRRRNFGRMTIRSGPTNIDQVYQEMSGMWPEFFDETRESTPSDQLVHIAEVLDGIYRVTERNPFSGYFDAAVTDASNEIMERFFDLPQTRPTFADRQARKLDDAKAAGRRRLAEQRERSDARLNELRQQNRERVQRAIQRERETRARQIDRLKTRYAARDAAGRERRSARELRARISRHVADLSRRLLRPSDKQHIPEQLRTAVAAMLDAINLESVYTVDPETGRRRKGGNGDPTKRTEAFRALREQYEAISQGKTDFHGVLDPELAENLAEVIAMGDTRLAEMNTEQLGTVWKVLRAVEASITSANKLFGANRYAGVEELARDVRESSRGKRAKGNYGGPGMGRLTGFGDQLLNTDMLNALTFLHLFGEGGDALYHELQTARDNKTRIMERTVELVQEVIGKDSIQDLQRETHTFQVEGGEITLTTAQLMSLYELNKREQAQDHIYKGGLRPTAQERRVGRGRSAAENVAAVLGRLDAPPEGVRVTQGDVFFMLSTLSDREIEIADGLQAIMQGYLAEQGNRESMKVYGYRKFTEDHYFPINSDPHQVQTKIGDILEGGEGRPVSVAEWGSSKGTVKGANNGLLLGDIFDVFAQHAVDMSTYASHLGTLEDVNRVRNFTFRDSEGTRTGSMGDIIQRVAGNGGNAYLDKLLQDMSRGTARGGVAGLSRLTANYKAASVGLNLRVALQQPTSYARALAVMDARYLFDPRAMRRGGWEKALKYAPIARWKDWGNFEINQGRQFQNILFNTDSAMERARNASMKLAGAMDSATWGRLWNACELEIADTRPRLTRGSEAFYEAVAQRFTDVVDQTQVVDNVLGRSQFMRSSDNLAKMASSYMGEPTQSYNLLYRSYRDAIQEQDPAKRGQAIKRFGRTAAALTFSMFLNAIAQSIWDGVRDDEDRDEKYWERVLRHILPNFAQNANPLGMVPYFRDILSAVQGYDVARMDMEAVTGLITAWQNMQKALNGEGRYTVAGASINLAAELARILGIPAATVKRDLEAIARSIGVETENWYFQYQIERALNSVGYSGNRTEFYNIAFGALADGDLETYQLITADLMEQGVKGSTIENAMRVRLEAAQNEDPDFSMSQEAQDLIGYRAQYAPETEAESGGFSVDDLPPAQRQSYAALRAQRYREIADDVEASRGFASLPQEVKDRALDSTERLAEATALSSATDGAQPVTTQWMLWATGGDGYGVDEAEAVLFKTAYDMAESDKDEGGKTIPGSKKENTLEIAGVLLPNLTERELEYLMANYWASEDEDLKALKERNFAG